MNNHPFNYVSIRPQDARIGLTFFARFIKGHIPVFIQHCDLLQSLVPKLVIVKPITFEKHLSNVKQPHVYYLKIRQQFACVNSL